MAGKKDVYDETSGLVVASGVSESVAKKIVDNAPSSHTVKVQAAEDPPGDA